MATAVAAAVCLAAATAALADGDPASDFLITQQVFAPYGGSHADVLRQVVGESKAQGIPVRVALIENQADLGSILVLWHKPEPYSKFLGQELLRWYRGPLLIVMPNGYGFYHGGKPTAREQASLAKLPLPSEAGDEALAAVAAVRRLAQLQGVSLVVPTAANTAASRNHDRLLIGAAVGAAVLVGLSIWVIRRRWLAASPQ